MRQLGKLKLSFESGVPNSIVLKVECFDREQNSLSVKNHNLGLLCSAFQCRLKTRMHKIPLDNLKQTNKKIIKTWQK